MNVSSQAGDLFSKSMEPAQILETERLLLFLPPADRFIVRPYCSSLFIAEIGNSRGDAKLWGKNLRIYW
jgi:hypothetical protein